MSGRVANVWVRLQRHEKMGKMESRDCRAGGRGVKSQMPLREREVHLALRGEPERQLPSTRQGFGGSITSMAGDGAKRDAPLPAARYLFGPM